VRTEALVESQPKALIASVQEAHELLLLGQDLASDKAWWGDEAADDESEDGYRPSVIRVNQLEDGRWSVNVVDAIGVVALTDLQLVVLPKIPLHHLLFLFGESERWPQMDDDAIAKLTSANDLAELVAHWYMNALERVLRLDLIRDYRLMEDDLESVRGQIVAFPTAALYYSGRLAAHCEFEEFDVDTPLNRVLKAAAHAIASSPTFGAERTKRAIRFVARMTEVGQLRPGDFDMAAIDRRTAHYRDALALARHVLRATGRTLTAGVQGARSFLIRSPEMVEEGLRNYLNKSLGPQYRVVKQGRQLKGSKMTLTPDLLFLPSGATGDVKYQISQGAWSRSHIYQGVTFATEFRTLHGLVISFSTATSSALADVRIGEVSLHSVTWNATSDSSAEESAQDVSDQVSGWLTSIALPKAAAG
jgi:hypothetical protein